MILDTYLYPYPLFFLFTYCEVLHNNIRVDLTSCVCQFHNAPLTFHYLFHTGLVRIGNRYLLFTVFGLL